MKHSNISIFVPHAGCPHKCSFCNQKTISGAQHQPTVDEVQDICSNALKEVPDRKNSEIAFFGGSFTAIERGYMLSLLRSAARYIGDDGFKGIRISTRPDFIDREVLDILKAHGVTSIELGAQSMKDHVLCANERGHTPEDVYKASRLIREYGFELGLQMMVGLYKSTEADEYDTMNSIIEINPDTVRIYPVVILKNTKLAELYLSDEYKTFEFDSAVKICADMIKRFESLGIRVIKCGLHASEFVRNDMVGGFYHPAFREICESQIYVDIMKKTLTENNNSIRSGKTGITFAVNPSCISKALGHKKANVEYFKKNMGIDIKIKGDENILKYQCGIRH